MYILMFLQKANGVTFLNGEVVKKGETPREFPSIESAEVFAKTRYGQDWRKFLSVEKQEWE